MSDEKNENSEEEYESDDDSNENELERVKDNVKKELEPLLEQEKKIQKTICQKLKELNEYKSTLRITNSTPVYSEKSKMNFNNFVKIHEREKPLEKINAILVKRNIKRMRVAITILSEQLENVQKKQKIIKQFISTKEKTHFTSISCMFGILETIFSYVTIQDLLKTCVYVSKHWMSSIISRNPNALIYKMHKSFGSYFHLANEIKPLLDKWMVTNENNFYHLFRVTDLISPFKINQIKDDYQIDFTHDLKIIKARPLRSQFQKNWRGIENHTQKIAIIFCSLNMTHLEGNGNCDIFTSAFKYTCISQKQLGINYYTKSKFPIGLYKKYFQEFESNKKSIGLLYKSFKMMNKNTIDLKKGSKYMNAYRLLLSKKNCAASYEIFILINRMWVCVIGKKKDGVNFKLNPQTMEVTFCTS